MMHFGLVMPSVFLVCLSVALSGCGSGGTGTITTTTTPQHFKWVNYHIEQSGGGYGLSVGVDGTVFWTGESEVDGSACLTAFDGDDGAFKWRLKSDVLGTFVGNPVVGLGDSLYMRTVTVNNTAPSSRSSVLAVRSDGTRKWIQDFNESEQCAGGVEVLLGAGTTVLLGSDGTVFTSRFCQGRNASLFALDGDDGTIKWQSPVGDLTGISLVMASDNTIFFTDDSCHVFAVQGTDGFVKWNVTIPGARSKVRSSSSPSLGANGTVLVCTDDGLVALDGKDGSVKWQQEDACYSPFEGKMSQRQSLFGAAAGSDGTVFVRSTRSSGSKTVQTLFHALNGDDGSIKWTKEISDMECGDDMETDEDQKACSFTTGAVSTDGTRVYVGLGSRVYGFDANSGDTVWNSRIEVEPIWNNALDQGNIPPVLGPDGTFFVSSPRTIYAFYSDSESIFAA